MTHIAFVDGTNAFDGLSVRDKAAGGIQHGTASLAEALARLGHRVTVFNPRPKDADINGVRWSPLKDEDEIRADLVIANNSVQLLDRVAAGRKVLWSRNPIKLHRLFKKRDLFAVFRHRPHAVFLGAYHASTATRLLPFSSRRIIPHAGVTEFVRPSPAAEAPPPRAIFVSQPYRGLDWLLKVWTRLIRPAAPDAELHIFTKEWDQLRIEDCASCGVVKRGRVPRAQLAAEMMTARLMLYPGHTNETFCFAAAEASAAGLPVVTRGIGSLRERVSDGRNGAIRWEAAAFATAATELLTDDALWLDLHRKTLACRDMTSWDDRAREWTKAFLA